MTTNRSNDFRRLVPKIYVGMISLSLFTYDYFFVLFEHDNNDFFCNFMCHFRNEYSIDPSLFLG